MVNEEGNGKGEREGRGELIPVHEVTAAMASVRKMQGVELRLHV